MLDEYAHVLHEFLGVQGEAAAEVAAVAKHITLAVSLDNGRVQVNVLDRTRRGFHPVTVRSGFALRFGAMGAGREEGPLHADRVRDAFNSPFQPFVLASTSIGQEGLDFHT